MGHGIFFQVMVYLVAAVVSVPIAKRLGLGSVLGYLIAGVLIGPYALSLVGTHGDDVLHFAEFGVVMMLFLIGLELRPAYLWKMRGPLLGLGGLEVFGVTAAVTGVCLALGYGWQEGLVIGMVLALSSTAIVLQTLNEKNLMKTPEGQNCFSVLLFQDLAVIPMLTLIPLLGAPQAVAAADGPSPLLKAAGVLGAIVGIVLVGQFLSRPIFRFIAATRMREIFTAFALLLVVAITITMELVGLSPALGTFLAGVVLADSEYRHELESVIDPFKGMLLGLFFISVGASIDFGMIGTDLGKILFWVAGFVTLKFLILYIVSRIFRMPAEQGIFFSLALAQGGEFAFVLFSFAVGAKVVSPETAGMFIAIVALSMLAMPLLLIFFEKVLQSRLQDPEKQKRPPDDIQTRGKVILAGFGRFGQSIGRMLLSQNFSVTTLDNDPSHIELVRKWGFKVFYGDASRADLLEAAGIEDADLFIVAVDNPDSANEIVDTIQKNYPHVKILARARNRPHAFQLMKRGIFSYELETSGSAIDLGIEALKHLGYRSYQATRVAKMFKLHDRNNMTHMHKYFGKVSSREFITEAKRTRETINRILQADVQDQSLDIDKGWDPPPVGRRPI